MSKSTTLQTVTQIPGTQSLTSFKNGAK